MSPNNFEFARLRWDFRDIGNLSSNWIGGSRLRTGALFVFECENATGVFLEDIGEIFTSFVSATLDTLKSLPLIFGINLFEEDSEPEATDLMNTIYASFEASSGGHALLAGLAFMVFVLIYTPCMVAISAERQELGAKWMWVSIIGQLILAWIMAFVVFQGGKLLGIG